MTAGEGEAPRRTSLAGERTMLAWVRTGLATTAVALGVGRVVPEVANVQHRWPYVVVGGGYALLGAALVGYGFRRRRALDRALRSGGFAELSERAMAVFGVSAVTLALLTALLVLVAP